MLAAAVAATLRRETAMTIARNPVRVVAVSLAAWLGGGRAAAQGATP